MSYIGLADGSVRRVRQLTGEWQRSPDGSRVRTSSATESRFGLVGTDLGASFFDGERLWFLFGDTWPGRELDDSIAWTTDLDPEVGTTLTFLHANGAWRHVRITGRVPEFTTGVFNVPTGGFALGGRRYVFFTSDANEQVLDGQKVWVMGSGALCRERDGGADLADLHHVFQFSKEDSGGRFVNAAPAVVADPPPGLPFAGPAVLVWGSGTYRRSHCYLAAAPATVDDVENRARWWFLSRVRADGTPEWINDLDLQHQAASLFAPPELGGNGGIGELSAAWIAPLGVWMLAYGYQAMTRGFDRMEFRTAPRPWGPWSPPQMLDNATAPALAHGRFLHRGWQDGDLDGTDPLYDRGRGVEWGAPYAPYLIDRFTRPAGPLRARVYFTISSWNPYQAHLMSADLARRPGDFVVQEPPPVRPLAGGGGRVHPRRWPLRVDRDERIDLDPPVRIPVDEGRRRIDLDPPAAVQVPTGGLSMIRSRFGPAANNFELIVPGAAGGLLFAAARNDPWPPAWGPVGQLGSGIDVDAAAMAILVASRPDESTWDRLVVAIATGDRIAYLYRDPDPPAGREPDLPWKWWGPYPVIAVDPKSDERHPLTAVRGNPALIGSTFGGRRLNLELVVPDATAGVRHYWFDNDPLFPLNGDWMVAPGFGQALGRVDAVAIIQSVFGPVDGAGRGNLEVVVRRGGELFVLWRDATMTWRGPAPVVAEGIPVTAASGVPALLQSRYGADRNDFQLVTPWAGGGLAYFYRDNTGPDPARWRWRGPAILDPHTTYQAASLVAGPFGPDPGNLELVATATNGTVRHFYRESTRPAWHDAGTIPV